MISSSARVKRSLISIDIARAIAALGVFYYHQQMGSVLAKYTGLKVFNATDNFGALYAVPLFFLISGYCIHLSNIKYLKNNQRLPLKEYYKRRFLRIYPPYLVAVLFSLAIKIFTVAGYSINWRDVLIHVFLLQGFTVSYFNSINIVLWTISIEMAFYILYPVFYYLRLKYNLIPAIVFTFAVSIVSISYFCAKKALSFPEFYCVFNLWFAWCCGAFMADKKAFGEQDLQKLLYKIGYGAIVVAFIFTTFFPSPGINMIKYQLAILIWTAPLLFLVNKEYWLAQQQSILLKILVAIGLSSYSLYLFHDPLIAIKNHLVQWYLPHQFQHAGVLTGMVLIPVVTWFSYLYIEKPFMLKKQK